MAIDPANECPNCGRELNPATGECRYCGPVVPAEQPVQASEPATVYQPPAPPPLTLWKLSGKWSPPGAVILFIVACISGVVIGYGYHITAHFFDFILISPALGGLIAGIFVMQGVKLTKTRNRLLAAAAGIVAGLLMYGIRNVADSYDARPDMVYGLSQDLADRHNVPLAQARASAEAMLTPWTTVRLYEEYKATVGIQISSHPEEASTITGPNGTQTNAPYDATTISGVGYYIMLGVEALCAALAAMGLAMAAFTTPFCEACDIWTKEQKPKLLKLNSGRYQSMENLLNAQDWPALVRLKATGPYSDKNYSSATLYKCEKCASGAISLNVVNGQASKQSAKFVLDAPTVNRIENEKRAVTSS